MFIKREPIILIYKKMEQFNLMLVNQKRSDNRLDYFFTPLHHKIDLNGTWLVGLSEISFPCTWFTVEYNEFIEILYYQKEVRKNKYNIKKEDHYDVLLHNKAFITPGHYTASELLEKLNY